MSSLVQEEIILIHEFEARNTRANGAAQAAAYIRAHGELQAFREEAHLHLCNTELIVGSKMPAYRFDGGQMSRQDREKHFVHNTELLYDKKPPPPAIARFALYAQSTSRGVPKPLNTRLLEPLIFYPAPDNLYPEAKWTHDA